MLPGDVARSLATLPTQPFAALRVLELLEDPDASIAELFRIVEMDPILAVKVMRTANSPLAGEGRKVTSVPRAVSLLGFASVKAIAASAALPLLLPDVKVGSVDGWAHSISVAVAASVVAPSVGVARSDAFAAGLLHDLGSLLLHHSDPEGYEVMLAEVPTGLLEVFEQETFGVTHSEAGAALLEQWLFPRNFVEALRCHHRHITSVNPIAQAIMLGESLAEKIDPTSPAELIVSPAVLGEELGIAERIPTLLADIRRETRAIHAYLESGR